MEVMDKIKKIRKVLGIKQQDFAELMGFHKTNYNLIENGKRGTEKALEDYERRAKELLLPRLESKIRETKTDVRELNNMLKELKKL